MENGLPSAIMESAGDRLVSHSAGVHTSMDTGSGQITAGPGYPIMIGDGHRSTMADGNLIHNMDGSGYQDTFGLLHGSNGAGAEVMPVGHRCRQDFIIESNVVVGPDYNDFGVGIASWNFIRASEMGRPRYGYVEREGIPRVIGSTRNVTQFRFTRDGVYNTGLPREQVERVIHHRIETVNIVRTLNVGRTRVEGNRFLVYSPAPLEPRVKNEGQVIQRERGYQRRQQSSQNRPQPKAPQRVRTERSSSPSYNPGKQGRNENKPSNQPKPKENNKSRERDSNSKDNGRERGH